MFQEHKMVNPNEIITIRGKYEVRRKNHRNLIAKKMRHWRSWGSYYHFLLNRIYSQMIPPGSKVMDIGCGNGDLLAWLKPIIGVGVDISTDMISHAKEKYPELTFINASEDAFDTEGYFDFIILSDILNDVWDVQAILDHIQKYSSPRTRVIINSYNRLWEIPLVISAKLGLSKSRMEQNWLTVSDIRNLLALSGFEVIRTSHNILFPVGIPGLAPLLNRFLVRFWPFTYLALTNFIIARQRPAVINNGLLPLVSVVVPARNEEGNVDDVFNRVPEMGKGTEIIFVEGHSTDNTYQKIKKSISEHPERPCKLIRQSGVGKGNAVREGFSAATGDILMILDADLTVPPEYLPRFYRSLVNNEGEFINGVRLVYPMEDEAMRVFNLIGNKFFSFAFTWLLGQSIKDTLCGTKVLWKEDYHRIAENRTVFGDFDPFGDFDLLFGASALNFKIIDLPIRYQARKYGDTNIQRWKHGWLLLKMVGFAARKIKFRY